MSEVKKLTIKQLEKEIRKSLIIPEHEMVRMIYNTLSSNGLKTPELEKARICLKNIEENEKIVAGIKIVDYIMENKVTEKTGISLLRKMSPDNFYLKEFDRRNKNNSSKEI